MNYVKTFNGFIVKVNISRSCISVILTSQPPKIIIIFVAVLIQVKKKDITIRNNFSFPKKREAKFFFANWSISAGKRGEGGNGELRQNIEKILPFFFFVWSLSFDKFT